ncbi:hypothetical protein [uncultured Eubacterium sp.]|uniref:hypothetical protein n=1 Tax=uncultured Eubacterium sp. TaxID=165185 RepID=UPI002591F29C|nr:hypothetical protein [uncultured Eubacterium sp.]
MKSYTDLKQSKKLVGILPLESADMIIVSIGDREGVVTTTMPKETFNMLRTPFVDIRETTPCWSLAALIAILPRFIEFKGDKYYLRFMKEYVEYANDEVSITGRCLHTTGNDNLVDACVEMILKLKENNLL